MSEVTHTDIYTQYKYVYIYKYTIYIYTIYTQYIQYIYTIYTYTNIYIYIYIYMVKNKGQQYIHGFCQHIFLVCVFPHAGMTGNDLGRFFGWKLLEFDQAVVELRQLRFRFNSLIMVKNGE